VESLAKQRIRSRGLIFQAVESKIIAENIYFHRQIKVFLFLRIKNCQILGLDNILKDEVVRLKNNHF